MSRRVMRLIYSGKSTRLVIGTRANVCLGKGRRFGYVVLFVYGMCVLNYPLSSPDSHRLPLLVFVYTCIRLAATGLLI